MVSPYASSGHGELNVMDKQADSLGIDNSSGSFIECAEIAKSTGAKVKMPAGTFKIEDVPLYSNVHYEGAGVGLTTLIAPGNTSMFREKDGANINGGGIIGATLIGNATSDTAKDGTVDAIDLSLSPQAESFRVNVFGKNFRRGYNGSQDDRSVVLQSNIFKGCVNGYYIDNNHPTFEGLNEAEDCTYGMTGDNLFDLVIPQFKAIDCTNGVAPQGGGFLRNSEFIGLILFGCDNGIELGIGCQLNGGQFVPKSNTDHLVKIKGTKVKVFGGYYRDSDGSDSDTADILFDQDTVCTGCSIIGATFNTNSVNILHDPNTGTTFARNNISLNTKEGGNNSFFKSLGGTAFRNQFNQNNIYVDANPSSANTDLFVVTTTATSGGNQFNNNNFRAETTYANLRYAINADLRASNSVLNISRNVNGVSAYNYTSTDGNTTDSGNQAQ